MAQTHVGTTGSTAADTGSTRRDGYAPARTERAGETRRAFKTTEFFVMLAAVAAVVIAGYAKDDSLDAARIWTLVTVIASAYMVSRGLAKAGSREWHAERSTDDR